MNTYYLTALDEQFKCDCKVINLSYEYPGYTGEEKWAIITDLTEEELIEKYEEIISSYRPFIVLSSMFGSVRADFIRNEDIFDKVTMTTGVIELKCPNCHRVVEVDLSLRKGTVKYRLTRSSNRANN